MYKQKLFYLLSILLDLAFGSDAGTGDNYVHPKANTRLTGHLLSRMERWTVVYCLMDCSNDNKCSSFNYNQTQQICELNGFYDDTATRSGENGLQKQEGWTFYRKQANVRNNFQ